MEMLYGTIQGVFPPGHPQNRDGYQYEYYVLAVGDNYASVPLHHVLRSDMFGATDEFSDWVLEKNQKVLVAFLKDYSQAFIVGAIRNSLTKMLATHHGLQRYRKVNWGIDENGNYSVVSDSGPTLEVNTDAIVLGDSAGDSIILDRVNKVLTINANKWNVVVQGDATIQAQGNVSVSGNDVDVTAQGDVNVTASGNVTVDAESVTLAGEDGQVVTTATHPVDYVTGIPIMGSTKVKAGS